MNKHAGLTLFFWLVGVMILCGALAWGSPEPWETFPRVLFAGIMSGGIVLVSVKLTIELFERS